MSDIDVTKARIEGKQAAAQGKDFTRDNPYAPVRHTKLGTPVFRDEGEAWREGFASVGRRATPQEVADAARMDVRNFGARASTRAMRKHRNS